MAHDDQRYEAVPIPTYDEAIAGGSWHDRPQSPIDDQTTGEREGQSLLSSAQNGRSRRQRGYRPPTVESDDEDSLLGSDSEDEAEHVRREMQELEIDDSEVHGRNRSSWGKRIGFSLSSLSLPQWRWRWRLRLPSIRLGREPDPPAAPSTDNTADAPGWRFEFPKLSRTALVLLVARAFALMLILGFLYLLFMSDLFSGMARRLNSQMFEPESVRSFVQVSVDPRRIRDTLKHYTGYAHLAGTEGDYALMEDTMMLFRRYGLEHVRNDAFEVYLNYPTDGGRAVEILGSDGKPTWTARLEEADIGGEVAGRQTHAFHGLSKSGDVKGPLIYANYGSRADFVKLKEAGIETKGAIAIVRYYGGPETPAMKVKAAEEAGFVGCLIYSDPADDGFRKGLPAPNGRYMPNDGVQRASVALTSWVVGDVLTPGWGTRTDLPHLKPEESLGLVKIPSLPLPWRDAEVLLQKIRGSGKRVDNDWPNWAGGIPKMQTWWTGNQSSPVVHLRNEQDEVQKQTIWNVYGRIEGIEQNEKSIIIGNQRDAWSFGASDPHSGTAVMMEVIRVFGDLVARGWRPLRTIEFMSWDGEAYNLIGSTEYVERNDEALRRDAFAYVNLGQAVTGSTFRAAGSPVFRSLLRDVLHRVSEPHFSNVTLLDLWDKRQGELEDLGADSSYVAFQDIVGTSSLDLRFDGPSPRHSSYDNFDLVDQVGDTGFIFHTLLAQVVGLVVLELSDRRILPFDMHAYADRLGHWVKDLESLNKDGHSLPLDTLKRATTELSHSVIQFDQWKTSWKHTINDANGYESNGLNRQRAEYNSRMSDFETDLLDPVGLLNRTQFKHVIFGPQLWPDSDAANAVFPSIRDAVRIGDWDLAGRAVEKVAATIKLAARNLVLQK